MSNWLQDAVKTSVGYAHPLTGEQLDCTSGLSSPVAYYDANSGDKSFIDPAGLVTGLIMFKRRKLFVEFALHAKKPIASVVWDFGDEGNPVTGKKNIQYTFAMAGTFDVEAAVTYVDTTTEDFTVSITVTA